MPMVARRGYKKVRGNEDKSKVKFDLRTLNWFCEYALSENQCIQLSGLSNLRSLLVKTNPDLYTNEPDLLARYNFCLDILSAKIDKKLSKREFCIADALGVVGNKYPDINPEEFHELNTTDANWILSNVISQYLNTADMIDISSELKSACITLDTSDASSLQENSEKLQNLIKDANNKIRRNQASSNDLNSINISDPGDKVDQIIATIRSPSHILKTGMQAFNKILGGGFEGGRVYSMFGLAGEGKSTLLKNLAYQIAMYNKGYICKDKTKKPCIIYLSMENQPSEEYQTMYNIAGYTENLKDLDGPSAEIVRARMRKSGWGANEPGDIHVWLEYAPINSVDTSYLYSLVEKYADLGYETVALFQDYIKRIRPINGNNLEERFRLGNVINDFKNFAVYHNIPVITASQLNREAARSVDDARKDEKFDKMMNSIGRANIGESSLIDENLDATILLAPCEKDNVKYLGIKITKHRYRVDIDMGATRFYQPFVQGNPVKLVEDVNCFQPAARYSLVYDENASIFTNGNNRFAKNAILEEPKPDFGEFGGFITDVPKLKVIITRTKVV